MSSCGVRVIARFRPLTEKEKKATGVRSQFDIQCASETNTVDISIDKTPHSFTFDKVYWVDSLQESVYEEAAKPCIEDVLEGYNATIFAYGQTGSGKTHTMFGSQGTPELEGIIPRASRHIFQHIEQDSRDIEYAIKCSFLEIYKERIYDLLSPNPKETSLRVREAPGKGVWVEGLTEEFISCAEDIEELIQLGNQSRSVAATDMNQQSSRSHSLFIIRIEQKMEDGSVKTGTLNLVDLAGSERIAKTNASGAQLEEAKEINKSLSTLGKCIHALSEASTSKSGTKVHIPYRESQLTRILQESLGGNTKTTLMITCSPAIYNADETLSTLRFGASAKTIKTVVSINKKRSMEEMEALLKNLEKEVTWLRKYCTKLEKQIEFMQSPDYDPSKPVDLKKLKEFKEVPLAVSPTALSVPLSVAANSPGVRRTRAGSVGASSPRALSLSLEIPDFSDDEDFDPLAVAEMRTRLENVQSTLQLQIDQLKEELKDAKENERQAREQAEALKESYTSATEKLEAFRAKSEQEQVAFTMRIQQLEEAYRDKVTEADESIIVLYGDNERLEEEVAKLRAAIAQYQSGGAVTVAVAPQDAESQNVEALAKKLRNAEEREVAANKRLEGQKERIAQISQQLAEVMAKQSSLAGEVDELRKDKEQLQKKLDEHRLALKEKDDKLAEQVKEMEKQLAQRRTRVFRPIRKKNAYRDALSEKVDISAHISTLKKTASPFLEISRREHERSQASRGESFEEQQRKIAYRKVFDSIDENKDGTITFEEFCNGLQRVLQPGEAGQPSTPRIG